MATTKSSPESVHRQLEKANELAKAQARAVARLKGQLLAFYQQHNATKMKDCGQLAHEWVGREAQMWKQLRDKYEPVLPESESSEIALAVQAVKAQSAPARESSPSTSGQKQRAKSAAAAAENMLRRTEQILRRGAQRQKSHTTKQKQPAAVSEKKNSKPLDPERKVG